MKLAIAALIVSSIGTGWTIFWGIFTYVRRRKEAARRKDEASQIKIATPMDVARYARKTDKFWTWRPPPVVFFKIANLFLPPDRLRWITVCASVSGLLYCMLWLLRSPLFAGREIRWLLLVAPIYLCCFMVFATGRAMLYYLETVLVDIRRRLVPLIKQGGYLRFLWHLFSLLVVTLVNGLRVILYTLILYIDVLKFANVMEVNEKTVRLFRRIMPFNY